MSNYLDLSRGLNRTRNAPGGPARIPVIPQYVALALGVIVEPFVHKFIATRTFEISWQIAFMQVGFGLLIAIAIFPAVYRNSFDPERPLFVQLCAIFTSGLGWQSLFSAATKIPAPADGVGGNAANAVANGAAALFALLFT